MIDVAVAVDWGDLVDSLNLSDFYNHDLAPRNLYFKTEVLLLAVIYRKFINTCIEYHGLAVCRYLSSLGFGCDGWNDCDKTITYFRHGNTFIY